MEQGGGNLFPLGTGKCAVARGNSGSQWLMSGWKYQFSHDHWSQASLAQPFSGWIIPTRESWVLLQNNQGSGRREIWPLKLTPEFLQNQNKGNSKMLMSRNAQFDLFLTCKHHKWTLLPFVDLLENLTCRQWVMIQSRQVVILQIYRRKSYGGKHEIWHPAWWVPVHHWSWKAGPSHWNHVYKHGAVCSTLTVPYSGM